MTQIEVGETYGYLTVLSQESLAFLCQCACGNKRILYESEFEFRRTCGCKYKPSPVGEKYGMWTVIDETDRVQKSHVYVKCRCDCGTEQEHSIRQLRSGKTTGCWKHKRPGKYLDIESKHFLNIHWVYRRSAKERNMYFDLSVKQVSDIIVKPCYYCGHEYTNGLDFDKMHEKLYNNPYNGIDRKDNSQGYYEENCVPCCRRCNMAKGAMSSEEFIDLAYKICQRQTLQ